MNVNIFEYGNTICAPEWQVHNEKDDFFRVYYVYSGSAQYRDEQHTVGLKKGHLYLFLNHQYQIVHDPVCPLHVLWFHCSISGMKRSDYCEIKIINKTPEYFFLKLLQTINDRSDILYRNMAEAFINYLQENFGLFHYYEPSVLALLEYIEAHLGESLSNDRLARMLNYNSKYFVRFFKARLLVTPQKYIKSRRMLLAAQMLRSGYSVGTTSEKCGYTNSNNFGRDFKKYYSFSPGEFIGKRCSVP